MIKYLFAISTGRSGSKYLSGLLEHAHDVSTLHEPTPIMNGKAMQAFLKGNPRPMEALMPEKLASIQAGRGEATTYVETNHCFIKGFGWLLPEHIPQEEMGVVIIKRDKEKIVNSYYKIGCFPTSSFGRNYLMTFQMRNPINKISFMDRLRYWPYAHLARFIRHRWIQRIAPLRIPAFIKNYEFRMLDWYVEETMAQGEKFKKAFPRVKYFETTTDELNDMAVIEKMFRTFGGEVNFKDSVKEVIGVPQNQKTEVKARQGH